MIVEVVGYQGLRQVGIEPYVGVLDHDRRWTCGKGVYAEPVAERAPRVEIVDCAQGGQAMAEWAPRDARPWAEAMRRIERAGVTPQQVQAAWVKLANKGPTGSLQEHGKKLEADTLALLQNAMLAPSRSTPTTREATDATR